MKKALLVGLVVLGSFGLAGCGVIRDVAGEYYGGFIRGIRTDVNHRVFKNSSAYVEGAADDLAKYHLEYITATDPVAKKGIVNVVVQRFANLDPKKVEDANLRSFLQDCKNGTLLMIPPATTAEPTAQEPTESKEIKIEDILGGN